MEQFVQAATIEHRFWLHVLEDHCQFICDSLYPSEQKDIAIAASFLEQFKRFRAEADKLSASDIVPFSTKVQGVLAKLKHFKLLLYNVISSVK